MTNTVPTPPIEITFVGYGEAASAFLQGWRSESRLVSVGLNISAYDIKSINAATAAAKLADYQRDGVTALTQIGAGIEAKSSQSLTAPAIISLVTADQAQQAAKTVSQCITPNAFYFDGNSCSPHTKQESAALIEAAGGKYVDMAIMSPVHPKLHQTPLLISGPHSEAASAWLTKMGMKVAIHGDLVGQASAVKMVRSVMVKGMEALMAECVLAARKANVDDTVIASLQQSFPEFDWAQRSAYNLERMMKHGMRRSTEMLAVGETLREIGLKNSMSLATADWQEHIGQLAIDNNSTDYRVLTDAILNALANPKD